MFLGTIDTFELSALGWDERRAEEMRPHAERGLIPARVAVEHRGGYELCSAPGVLEAHVAGSLRHAAGPGGLPVVGDWVAVRASGVDRRAAIQAVLARRSAFVRRAPGQATEEQVLAANVDTVFLVSGLDGDFNPRRIERYLVLAWASGARPVVVLSKADLASDLGAKLLEVEAAAPGVPIHAISALRDDGLASLAPYLRPGQTVALLGSSGVGKSTLVNRLVGRDLQRTAAVRAGDSRGHHTTTRRELIPLPGGGLVVDTPGLREIQLWEAGDGHQAAFDDLERLAEGCRFPDCSHRAEPGCAVRRAVAEGRLPAERLESYLKLGRELRHLELRLDKRAQAEQRRGAKAIHKAMRRYHPPG